MKQKTAEELQDLSILTVITGSKMYGLDIETSDEDLKSIVKLPTKEIITLGQEWETSAFHDPDTEFHSLKKMIKLLNSQNPTVLEMLYADPEFIVKITDEGKELVESRDLFLSQNCYNTFSGYAKDQLMRIKNGLKKATVDDQADHLKYHMELMVQNLPKKYTEIQPGTIVVNSTEIDSMGKGNVKLGLQKQEISLSQLGGMVSEMNASLRQYNKVNNRNRKPEKKLAKHAMHLVKLLKQGIHVQMTGEIKTSWKDHRDELIKIRNGEMDWDDFFSYTDHLFAEMETARENSILAPNTDEGKIEALYKKIQLKG